jgi:hypothetical protein
VLLGFGVSLIAPAEDVPETAYDESETLPYVSTSIVSIAASKVAPAPSGWSVVAVFQLASFKAVGSQHQASSPYPIGDSFTILDRSLRC